MATIIRQTLPIVDALRAQAERQGLSTRGMAEELDVSPTTVSNWYRGNVTPALTADNQRRFAQFLEISPRQVVELFEIDLSSEALRGSLAFAA